MTNLEELFEVFNGQQIDKQFQQTLDLIRMCRKDKFVEIEDEVSPLRAWMKSLQEDNSPYRLTYHDQSLSLRALQNAVRERRISTFIKVISLIKSEMMGCASAENFQTVKNLYTFWDNMEMSLNQINL